jgi:hypothetical protein
VPQHIYLSDDTVAANIAFGLAPEDINYEAVERASKISNLYEFVMNELPKKFLTMPDLIKMFIKKKLKVGVYEIKEYWKGIENIENLHEVSRKNI